MNGSGCSRGLTIIRIGRLLALAASLAAILVLSVGARAESGGPSASSGSALVDSLGREILAFEGIPRRSGVDIAADLDGAQRASKAAEQDQAAASALVIVMKARVEVIKQVIDVAKARLDLAKKEKREAEMARLERLREQEEREMSFLDRLAELHQAVADHAKARKDLADARVDAFQLENELEARRVAIQSVAPEVPTGTMEKPARDLEKRALEAMGEVASREQDVAGKDKDITERRMSLFELADEYRQFLQQPRK